MPISARLACAVFVLLASARAQPAVRVVPPWAEQGDLVASSYAPFQSDVARAQQIWNPSAVASGVGLLVAVRFRRDAMLLDPYAGRTLTTAVVLGHSFKTAQSMSRRFVDNWGSTPTVVLAGPYSLPAQPPPRGVGSWNVLFALSFPFVYDPAQGSLLMDWWIVPSRPRVEYRLDAHRDSPLGQVQDFGITGRFAGGDIVRYSAIGDLRPAGSLGGDARFLGKPYPSVALLGVSNRQLRGVPLPFDLVAFGAPGNYLYTSSEFALPMQVTAVGARYAARFLFALPNNPWLSGRMLYTQAYMLDPASNSLGAVFTNAVGISFGGGVGFTRSLVSFDPSLPGGVFLFGSDLGGPAVRFEGWLP